jgi:protoporphyrinogen IX oxidase
MYTYIKALHIIFVVTWFAGLFYFPRLFIYNTEANEKPLEVKNALQEQFRIMMKRLWYGITWPSAILTLIFGITVMLNGNWHKLLGDASGKWLVIKLAFVVLLYSYHYSLHIVFKQQMKDVFKYSSQQLRIWNEVATILLIAIVMLATVKESISFVWGIIGMLLFITLLMSAIKIYKNLRKD